MLRGVPLLVVAIAGLVAYGSLLVSSRLLPDEERYVCAFTAAASDHNPYTCHGYFYPPLLAVLGGHAADVFGLHTFLVWMRALNLLGAIGLVTFAATRIPGRRAFQALLGAVLVAFGTSIDEAMGVGNLSPLCCALAVAALANVTRAPALAGVALGTSIALKPIAAAAVPLLLAVPKNMHGARHRVAALVAGGVVALLVLPWYSWLPSLFRASGQQASAMHNLSLVRVAHLLGFEVSPLVVLVAVPLLFAIFLRDRLHTPESVVYLGGAASLLSLPIVWGHTFILAYPIVTGALAASLLRWRAAAPGVARARARAEGLLVCAASMWVLQSNAFSGITAYLPAPLGALVLAFEIALPSALALHASAAPADTPAAGTAP